MYPPTSTDEKYLIPQYHLMTPRTNVQQRGHAHTYPCDTLKVVCVSWLLLNITGIGFSRPAFERLIFNMKYYMLGEYIHRLLRCFHTIFSARP